MKTVRSIVVDPVAWEAVLAYAAANDTSASALLRTLLRDWLKKNEKTTKVSL